MKDGRTRNRLAFFGRRRAGLGVLVLVTLGLACTYGLRQEYRLPVATPVVDILGWTITPKIISPTAYSELKEPVSPPSEFAVSFRAARPRPARKHPDSIAVITDIRLGSARVVFRRTGVRMDWRFNEAAWVSYAAVSPDSLVKTFRVVREFGELDWVTLPAENDTLDVTLYARSHTGLVLAERRASNAPVALDTAYWRPKDEPPVQLPPVTMQLERRDILTAMPGFRSGGR